MDRRAFLWVGGAGVGAMLLGRAGAGAAACLPTEPNPEGPFYLPGAPFAHDLAHPEEAGRRLVVEGRVLDAGSGRCAAVPDAVVDVWHANGAGVYYGLERSGAPEPLSLRGRVRTDSEGAYAFRSVLPGHYPLGPNRVRPRHIHYRVSAPGYRTLITQLYFAGDPALDGDALVRPALVTPLTEAGERLHCSFAVVLVPLS